MSTEPRAVLVVEDRDTDRLYLTTLLGYGGFTVLEAASGDDGLAAAMVQRPDLVISDVLMPNMDGYEFVRRLRRLPNCTDVPVIFYTATYHEAEARQLAEECGVFEVLIKPSEPEVILARVATVLQRDAVALDVMTDVMTDAAFDRRHGRLTSETLMDKVRKLEASERRMAALVRLGQQFMAERDPAKLLRRACDELRDATESSRAMVGVLSNDLKRFTFVSTPSGNVEIETRLLAIPELPAAFSRVTHDRQALRGRTATGILENLDLGFDLGSFLIVPLMSADQVLGVMAVVNKIGADEFRIRRHDGVYRWFRTMAMPARDASGRIYKWFGSNTDIDDRKRAEAELQSLTAALEHRVEERTAELKAAKELAESADRLKTDFITTMSHELRTPLNSIIGFTGTLLSRMPGPLNQAQDQQLRIVQTSGRHLLMLINDVLDVARIESGASEYNEVAVDVRELIRSAAAEQAPLAESKGLTITTRLGSDPLVLMTDERALRQILTNLINNAIKFTQRGSVDIKVSATVVRGARRFELAVCDSGIGIAPEHMGRLFMKFSRLHEAHQSVAGGTGLGLYLCQLLADRLGARIEVTSEVGKGSCFTVCFPSSAAQRASQ